MVKQDVMTEEDEEARTSMKLPVDLLDEFKHLAIDKKTTVTALIIEAMDQFLKKEGGKK